MLVERSAALIRAARDDIRLSTSSLASVAGVDHSTVEAFEAGTEGFAHAVESMTGFPVDILLDDFLDEDVHFRHVLVEAVPL